MNNCDMIKNLLLCISSRQSRLEQTAWNKSYLICSITTGVVITVLNPHNKMKKMLIRTKISTRIIQSEIACPTVHKTRRLLLSLLCWPNVILLSGGHCIINLLYNLTDILFYKMKTIQFFYKGCRLTMQRWC